MNPWHIIGWFLIGVMALVMAFVTVVLLVSALRIMRRRWWSFRDRNILPSPGQVWIGKTNTRITIKEESPERLFLQRRGMAWGMKKEAWEKKKRRERMFLVPRR